MTRLVRNLRRFAIFAFVIALIYSLYDPVWRAAKWVAWNWVRVDFVAVCRVHEKHPGYKISEFDYMSGPYSGEFIREVIALWTTSYPDIELGIEGDGTLIVPLGFYLPVDTFWERSESLVKEKRGYFISALSAYEIFSRRLAEGVDMAPYQQFSEWAEPLQDSEEPRRLDAPVCGLMDELILDGGSLARR